MRASFVPTLYAGCLNKRSSNFLFVALVGLCDLEAPGWGEPRFPHCAVLLLKLTDCGMAFS